MTHESAAVIASPVETIASMEALARFMSGELVTAHDMEYRLDRDSHFLLSEKEMLDPNGSLRSEEPFPLVKVDGMEGVYFCPAAVTAFMEKICAGGEDDDEEEDDA